MEGNAPIIFLFIPRQMGKMKHWLNGQRRCNDQAVRVWWLVLAHLLPFPIVKVSYGDGSEGASMIVAASWQVAAPVQLQLVGFGVGILRCCCSPLRPLVVLICAIPGRGDWGRESPGSDLLDEIAVLMLINLYWVDASILKHEGTIRPLLIFLALLFVDNHTWFDKIQLMSGKRIMNYH